MGSVDRQDNTPQLLNRLRMRQLALILAIEEQGTLRAAAAQLGLTQPAASKMLHELEDALGLPLFERVGRSLRLNVAGDRVTRYFRNIHGSMEALNREIGDLRASGGAGRLAVGSIMAASPGRLTHALLGLKAEFPQLSVEVAVDTCDRLLAQLDDGVLEVVIGRLTEAGGKNHLFHSLDEEALSIVVGNEHPLLQRRSVSFESLCDYAWVLQPQGSPMRELVEREFRRCQQPLPRGLIETGSIITALYLIRHSTMIAVIATAVAKLYAEHGLLRILPCRLQGTLDAYGTLIRRDRPLTLAAKSFLTLLHQAPPG